MGERFEGRRREDVRMGELPEAVEPGDYWRYLTADGSPLTSSEPGNLTGGVWGVCVPGDDELGIGLLTKHTVREHDDGTISILPNDGSSNSVKVDRGDRELFHGYIERGVWRSV